MRLCPLLSVSLGPLSCVIHTVHLDLGCTFLIYYNVFNTRNGMYFAFQVVFNEVETLFTILNVAPAKCSDCKYSFAHCLSDISDKNVHFINTTFRNPT